MGITKDDVTKALASLESSLPSEAGEYVAKGEDSDEDLNSANGAAIDKGGLGVDAEDMNDKYGNKKKKDSKKSMEGATMAGIEKSTPSDFSAGLPGEIETKVDVSNFLKSLVDHTAESHDSLRDFVVKSDMANEARYEDMDASFEEVQKSLANVGVVLKAICERIGVIENQPAISKSQTSEASLAAPVARSFAKSNLDQENPLNSSTDEVGGIYKSLQGRPPQIVKSMISDKLCDLVRKGEAKDIDVINFETYNHVSPELDEKLRQAFA